MSAFKLFSARRMLNVVSRIAVFASLLGGIYLHPQVGAVPPTNFVLEDVLTGLEQPMGIRFLPDGRMLLIQKKGAVRIVTLGSTIQSDLYMNLAASTHADGLNSGQERGVIDLAVDPAFPASPYIYIFYTPASGPNGARARIARFTHVQNSGGIASRGNLTSELVLWQDTDGYDSCCHYGGGLDFGPDGKLWLTTGDHFQGSYAASLQKAGGSVIRINKNGTIPSDNPFSDGTGPNVDSLFAYGLRNPFRARWDLVSGRLFIGEVGGNDQAVAWEDLHVISYDHGTGRFVDDDFGTPSDNRLFDGLDFGWPECEGLPPHTNFPGCSVEAVAEPIFAYPHNGITAAINGGLVYRGTQFPSQYQGAYFYADSTRDFIRYLKFNSNGSIAPNPNPAAVSEQNPERTSYPFDLAPVGRIVYLEVGPDGALYYVSFTDSGGAYGQPNPFVLGAVRRYVYEGVNARPEILQFTATPASGPAPLETTFSFRARDPENNPMSYKLLFGDGVSSGPLSLAQDSTKTVSHVYSSLGDFQARLEVSDASGLDSETVHVLAGSPPVITRLGVTNSRPGSTTNTFRFGDVMTFSANATDLEDGALTGANFLWSISFVRPGNTHPALGPLINASPIQFPIPDQGQGFSGAVFYRCFITATDSSGLSTSASIDIFPEKVDISFNSVPSGILVQVNGDTARPTPFVLDTLIGFYLTITVPPLACVGDDQFQFINWSSGAQTPQFTYVVPTANSTLTANYNLAGPCPLSIPSSGLVLHLKTDAELLLNGNNVISWKDQSGFNNHLNAIGNPSILPAALNGSDAIRFDGVDDALARAGFNNLPTLAGNRSLFMVARYNGLGVGLGWTGFSYGTTKANQAFGLTLTGSGTLGVQGWGLINDIESNPPVNGIGSWLVQGAVLQSGTLRQYKNGALIGTASHTYNTGIGGVRIGEELNQNRNLPMDVLEILVYNRALSSAELQEISQYSALKYGIMPGENQPPAISSLSASNSRNGAQPNRFRFGDTITFSATATDSEDGTLSGADYNWNISFQNESGSSPVLGPKTGASLAFPIPTQPQGFGGNAFYRCSLTVRDSVGASTTSTLDIFPEKVTITVATIPPGIPVQVDGSAPRITPFLLDTLINYTHAITAPATHCLSPSRYNFSQWQNGSVSALLNYTVPLSNTSITATYTDVGPCDGTSPIPLNGLVFHVKSDAGLSLNGTSVTGWKDQTVNANQLNAIGNPTLLPAALSGYDVVHFDGVDDALARSGLVGLPVSSQNRSIFLVTRYNALGATKGLAGFTYGTPSANQVFGVALTPSGILAVQGWGSDNDFPSSPPINGIGSWLVQGVAYDAGTLTQYKDGGPIGTASHIFNTGTGGIRLGEELNGGRNLNMDVAEVLAYDRALSPAEIQQVTSYAQVKYGIATNPSLIPVTDGLTLQLESDLNVSLAGGATVSGWLDQSGLGNDLVASGNPQLQPDQTPTGKPAIHLDGNGDKLERIHSGDPLGGLPAGNSDRTLLLVVKYNSAAATIGLAYGTGAQNQAFGLLVRPAGSLMLQGWGSANDLSSSASGIGAGWLLQSGILRSGTATLFKNSVQVAQWGHTYNTVLTKLVIGEEIKRLGYGDMEIAAALIYNRALSDLERSAVEGYLRSKYLNSFTIATQSQTAPQNFAVEKVQLHIERSGGSLVRLEWPVLPNAIAYHLHSVTNIVSQSITSSENRIYTFTQADAEELKFLHQTSFALDHSFLSPSAYYLLIVE